MRSALEDTLHRIWRGHRPRPLHPLERLLYWLLIPFATLYASLVWGRREFRRIGFIQARSVSGLAVVSIGNLTVGGTGKTPLVIGLARGLLERDVRVAVVSRGYGAVGRGTGPLLVSDGTSPLVGADRAGDEPVMIASAVPAVVIVSRNRYLGARLAKERYGAQVVILDDGFQHLTLKRDADIVLLDAADPFGNGWTLPAGRLREPLSALRDADLFLFVNRGIEGVRPIPDRLEALLQAFRPEAVVMNGVLRIQSIRSGGSTDRQELEWLRGRRVLLVSGLANPDAFEAEIGGRGAEIATHLRFPDHHPYSADDLGRIQQELNESGADTLITTAKDEVKLLPAGLAERGVPFHVAEAGFDQRTLGMLVEAVAAVI
jgi:tetraacyldisaccharide 4'-kinase